MIGRAQLPAWSPVRPSSIGAALASQLRELGARDRLADRLRSHYAAAHVTLTGSGTCALALALETAVGGDRSRAVALPAYACWDLASACVAADVRVMFYDLDPDTLAPDYDSLRARLRSAPAAVVIVHQYGVSVDLTDIAAEVRAAGAVLIEDAAQAFGSMAAGQPAGSAGSMTVLSFGRGKGLTGGSGGALLSRHTDAGLPQASPPEGMTAGMRDLLGLVALWGLGRPALYSLPAALPWLRLGETVYHDPTPARRQSGASAAAVLANWNAALAEVRVRRGHANRLMKAGAHSLRVGRTVEPGFLRLPVRLKKRSLGRRERRLGILPGYPVALCDLPQLTGRVIRPTAPPGARHLARSLVTLPVHGRLAETDIAALEEWIASAPILTCARPRAVFGID